MKSYILVLLLLISSVCADELVGKIKNGPQKGEIYVKTIENTVDNLGPTGYYIKQCIFKNNIINAYVFSQKTNNIPQCTQSAIDLKSDEFFAKYKDFFCKEPDYTNKIIERERFMSTKLSPLHHISRYRPVHIISGEFF